MRPVTSLLVLDWEGGTESQVASVCPEVRLMYSVPGLWAHLPEVLIFSRGVRVSGLLQPLGLSCLINENPQRLLVYLRARGR